MILTDFYSVEEALRLNDKEAFFKVLYKSYAHFGVKVLKSFDLNPLTPEDIIQNVFIDWQKKDLSFFKVKTLRSLLVVSCINKAKDVLKSKKKWKYKIEFTDLALDAPDLSFQPELFDDTITHYLQILKPKYRDVFIDYLNGYKLREIAERRCMNLSTVKHHKLKAQHYLRCHLAKEFSDEY